MKTVELERDVIALVDVVGVVGRAAVRLVTALPVRADREICFCFLSSFQRSKLLHALAAQMPTEIMPFRCQKQATSVQYKSRWTATPDPSLSQFVPSLSCSRWPNANGKYAVSSAKTDDFCSV